MVVWCDGRNTVRAVETWLLVITMTVQDHAGSEELLPVVHQKMELMGPHLVPWESRGALLRDWSYNECTVCHDKTKTTRCHPSAESQKSEEGQDGRASKTAKRVSHIIFQ